MAWVKFDDQMPISRKVAPLSDPAFRLWAEAICWSNRNLTDGAIAQDELAEISKRGKPTLAAELVRRRLWHPAGEECGSQKCPPPTSDGWVIHDYWDYQPTRAQVLKDRDAKTKRQQRWRAAKRGVDGRVDATVDGTVDASRDGPVDALVAPTPSPSPPRPEGRRERGSRSDRTPPLERRDAGGDGRKDQNHQVGSPPNGAAPPPAEVLGQVRAKLRAASSAAKARGHRREDALNELRAITEPPAAEA